MEKFTVHTGRALPLRRSNVDTDQIIPAVYLKRVTRSGFEDGLFAAWDAVEPGRDQHGERNRETGQGGAGQLISPGQHMVDLHVAWRAVIEHRVEITRESAQIFRKFLRIKDLRQPPQADQSVHRRREIDPAERQLGREVHALGADSRDR